ncbi:hypothetical protein ACLB2K_072661 [Fragaria x ananassa]
MRPLLLFLLLLLLHLRHSLSSPHRLFSTPTRPMATYRALLSLKSSLDDPDSRLSSWTPNTSHCTWAGVTCDSHNHVTSLDLSGLNLSGYLSPDIAFLVYLSNLTLAENNLSCPIPPEISALRLLNLSNNVFNSTFPAGALQPH